MAALIYADGPASWQELEARVADVLRECGYDVEVQKKVDLARGEATIDVWADEHSSPPNVIAVECKHWARAASQTVVHAFRAVVGDSGANTGLIVSSAGFQRGAIAAAAYSNVRLIDWTQFQEMFVLRWFKEYMCPRIAGETDALHEYTEPINSRIARKENALAPERRERAKDLRIRYFPLAVTSMAFNPIVHQFLPTDGSPIPDLPLRASSERPRGSELVGLVPDDVLDAPALRPLMDALLNHSRRAAADFDEVFGERA